MDYLLLNDNDKKGINGNAVVVFDSKMIPVKIFVLLLIAVWSNEEKFDSLLCSGGREVVLSYINFTLYNKTNQQNGILLTEQNLAHFNPNLRVILIIHGWLVAPSSEWVLLMKDAYLNLPDDANVITIDWSFYSDINYREAYCSVPEVGNLVGDLIYNLTVTPGISLTTVQINGFSLGAHVAGYAGQRVQLLNKGSKIGRINGLDASLQFFWYPFPGRAVPINRRLDASDANFVQAIHTSNYQFGYPSRYGTVDFYVNSFLVCGGDVQNGCPFHPEIPTDGSFLLPLFCNHVRAIAYFIESITTDNFIGVRCDSCLNFKLNKCFSNSNIIMGENCPSTASDEIYLNTNQRSPLALGSPRAN